MTTLTHGATSAWQTSTRWWSTHPHAMPLVLAGFAVLFASRCAYDYVTGDLHWAAVAAVCAGLAVMAAVFEVFWVQFRAHLERKTAGRSGAA